MSRTTAIIPDDLADLIEGAAKAGFFENKSDAIRHVLGEYFDQHQNARIAAGVALYEEGETILGTAARLTDINQFGMRDILREEGIDLRFGPEDMAAVKKEIDAARDSND